MPRLPPFITGTFAGLLIALLLLLLIIRFLPNLLVTRHAPHAADGIVVLGGDSDGSRLLTGLRLHDQAFAPKLLLVAGSKRSWLHVIKKYCPDCVPEGRGAIFLEGSTNTVTDAQISLAYCRDNNLRNLLVVTSPYHTRRTQFIFNDIFTGSGISTTVISSGGYGTLLPPDGQWWRDRKTLENVWLEFGKILYWELTPFMEFQGE